jgi:hypothetical protein
MANKNSANVTMADVEQNAFGNSEALIQQIADWLVRECNPNKILAFTKK